MKLKSLGLALALGALSQASVQAADRFFNEYRVAKVYTGKLKLPDFKGRDKGFADYRTRITEAMKMGVTFAGEHSVMEAGCGSGCKNVVVANNRTGQLYRFPRGGENNQALTLQFEPDSNLMLVRWATDPSWKTCIFETYLFADGHWIPKEAFASQTYNGPDPCGNEVQAGMRRQW